MSKLPSTWCARLLVALLVLVAGAASGAGVAEAQNGVAAINFESPALVGAAGDIAAGHVGSEGLLFDDGVSGCRVAPRALPPGSPGRVVGNALEPHELVQAQRVVDFRGGTFVGNAQRAAPGIDGTLSGVNASLKTYSGSSPAGVLRHASRAETFAANAGYSGVEVFIDAGNVSRTSILGNRGLAAIPSQGTVSSIYVRTADGWVVFPG